MTKAQKHRHADNFLWFMNTIVKHRFPKAQPWQANAGTLTIELTGSF